jgi:hypothetical protein
MYVHVSINIHTCNYMYFFVFSFEKNNQAQFCLVQVLNTNEIDFGFTFSKGNLIVAFRIINEFFRQIVSKGSIKIIKCDDVITKCIIYKFRNSGTVISPCVDMDEHD